MKCLIFSALLYVATCNCFAAELDTLNPEKPSYRFAIKWSPVHLFDFFPTAQLALEYRIRKTVSLQLEGGYVIRPTGYEEEKDGFDKRGLKSKLDVRRYFSAGRSGRHSAFIAPELYYHRVNYKKSGTFGIDCEDGDCSYFRFYTYDVRYREYGLTFKGGFFHRFGNHFCMEYHIGLSQRFIRYGTSDKPADKSYEEQYERRFLDFSPKEESRNTFYPATGFRIGYIF